MSRPRSSKPSPLRGQYLRPQKEQRIDPATGRAPCDCGNATPGAVRRSVFPSGWGPFARSLPTLNARMSRSRASSAAATRAGSSQSFLVNGQMESKPKDHSWLFQPQLAVEATDGSPIFIKKTSRGLSEKLDSVFRAEEEAMAMLYRHQVEFAVGHGVSVHAETAPGRPDRAVRIRTQVIPRLEVPARRRPRPMTPTWTRPSPG